MTAIIHRYWKQFLIEGILLVLLGILALALPVITTFSLTVLIGSLLIVGGVAQGYRAIRSWKTEGSLLSLINAIITAVLGLLILIYPVVGALSLTFLLVLWFFVEGILKIFIALRWRHMKNWGWLLLSGCISILLAVIILSGWPGTAAWVMGLLLGINLIFSGSTLIAIAFAGKQLRGQNE